MQYFPKLYSFHAQDLTLTAMALLEKKFVVHGVQEQTIGRKKWSRLLTWEKVFFDALAINLWQK